MEGLADVVLRGTGGVVRVWGNRGTLQVVCAEDWRALAGAVGKRVRTVGMTAVRKLDGGGVDVCERVLEKVREVLAGGVEVRSDVVESVMEKEFGMWADGMRDADRELAWIRIKHIVFMLATLDGHATRIHAQGSSRVSLKPRDASMPWEDVKECDAVRELAARYFAGYGPAAERDFRYWMGLTAGVSKRAVDELVEAGVLCAMETDDGGELLVHESAAHALRSPIVPRAEDWPVRLLGRFEPVLVAHENKSWVISEAHRKRVWTRNADIVQTVLVRGRIRGVWRREGAEVTVRLFARCAADDWDVSRAEIARIRQAVVETAQGLWELEEVAVIVLQELEGGGEQALPVVEIGRAAGALDGDASGAKSEGDGRRRSKRIRTK